MISSDVSATEMNGAYCPLSWNDKRTWEGQVILKETNKGLCLREFEVNRYNDSDFYMEVWNPEKGIPETVLFATTRGWSYPCLGSSVDATPKVCEAYKAWKVKYDRCCRIEKKLAYRKETRRLASLWGMGYFEAKTLRAIYSGESFDQIDNLLKTKKFRSKFRESLSNQVRNWVKSKERAYNTPLSRKQFSYL